MIASRSSDIILRTANQYRTAGAVNGKGGSAPYRLGDFLFNLSASRSTVDLGAGGVDAGSGFWSCFNSLTPAAIGASSPGLCDYDSRGATIHNGANPGNGFISVLRTTGPRWNPASAYAFTGLCQVGDSNPGDVLTPYGVRLCFENPDVADTTQTHAGYTCSISMTLSADSLTYTITLNLTRSNGTAVFATTQLPFNVGISPIKFNAPFNFRVVVAANRSCNIFAGSTLLKTTALDAYVGASTRHTYGFEMTDTGYAHKTRFYRVTLQGKTT
jgi:hypothetical protein